MLHNGDSHMPPDTILVGDIQDTVTQSALDNWGPPIPRSTHSLLNVADSAGLRCTLRAVHPDTSAISG